MAQRLSDEWLDALRSRINIVDVVSEYVLLKPKGKRFWGLCPFHNEKTASFSVDSETQMYYCFGCHKGGTVIQFIMELERMPFMDAVTMLAERAHFPLPEGGGAPTGVDRAFKDRVYEANLAAARWFHEQLWTPQGAAALAYLHKRGLDDGAIRRFGLGASGDGWTDLTDALKGQGFEDEVLVRAGLTVRRDERRFDMFRQRAIFPILNAQGRVLGFGGRALGGGEPKYLNTPDSPVFNKRQGLYALNFVRNERGLARLILVEGYMDVVSLRRAGVPGVVATLGTALTPEQARLIKRYAPEVYVAYDGDAAGQKAILRALDIFDEQGVKARVLVFPDGLDPDDFIRRDGLEGFNGLPAVEPVAYRMRRAAEGIDLSSEDGRAQYAIACCTLLRKVGNPVELEMYVGRLMIETGFTKEALMRQVGASAQAETAAPIRRAFTAEQIAKETPAQRAQRRLLLLIAARLIPAETVAVADFDDPLYAQIADLLLTGLAPAAVMERVAEEDRTRAAASLYEEYPTDAGKALSEAEDCLAVIRRGRADEERKRLQAALQGADPEQKAALVARIMALTKEK